MICTKCGQEMGDTASHVCQSAIPLVVPEQISRPWRCPVCNGAGVVSRPPHVPGDVLTWGSNGTQTYPCRACGGTGIVWG